MEQTKKELPLLLIADDMPTNLRLISGILGEENYQMFFAHDGEMALSMTRELKPDLILMDIVMPKMNGIEVCMEIKKDKKLKHIPIIFLTAKDSDDDVIEGFEAGAVDYVTKPFNGVVLRARVNTHVELKLTRDNQQNRIEELSQAVNIAITNFVNMSKSRYPWEN
ncbi:response regulator [Myxococcota bacterium]|nr:response regulator [Myxococcota bacterium]MBU1536220.1 response regulator [Myxococcota bacterium]